MTWDMQELANLRWHWQDDDGPYLIGRTRRRWTARHRSGTGPVLIASTAANLATRIRADHLGRYLGTLAATA